MTVRGVVLGLACAVSAATAVPADTITPDDVRAHDRRIERRIYLLPRARISHPQKISAALAAIWVRQQEEQDCTVRCAFRGWLVQVEPGLAGGQLAAGWGTLVGETKGIEPLVRDVFVGFGVKAALLRTWGDANLDPSSETLVGLEGEFVVAQVNLSLGAFRSLTAGADSRWILGGGLGWGF